MFVQNPLPTLNIKELRELAIRQALELTRGNIPMAAKKLGIGRATLYRHLNPSKKLPRTDPRQLPLYKDEDGNSKD